MGVVICGLNGARQRSGLRPVHRTPYNVLHPLCISIVHRPNQRKISRPFHAFRDLILRSTPTLAPHGLQQLVGSMLETVVVPTQYRKEFFFVQFNSRFSSIPVPRLGTTAEEAPSQQVKPASERSKPLRSRMESSLRPHRLQMLNSTSFFVHAAEDASPRGGDGHRAAPRRDPSPLRGRFVSRGNRSLISSQQLFFFLSRVHLSFLRTPSSLLSPTFALISPYFRTYKQHHGQLSKQRSTHVESAPKPSFTCLLDWYYGLLRLFVRP